MSEGDRSVGHAASSQSLTAKTVAGLRWTYLESVSTAGAQAVYVAVMSRLLDPVAFGLMAIANLSMVLGFQIAQMGVANALIQRSDIDEQDVRAGFTSGLVLGALTASVFLFTAPLISDVFNEPDAVGILRVMAGNFLLTGLQMTSQGLLRRALRFRVMAIVGVVATVSGFVVGIVLALLGAGVWSLVTAVLTHSVLRTALYYAATRHSLRPILRWTPYRELYSFGSRSTSLRFLEFLGGNLDTFAVGRYTSTYTLGLYNRAFYLVKLPMGQYLANSLTKVLFPGFSRIQADDERTRRVYLNAILLGGVVLFPICAGIAVASRELILVVLGDGWDAAAVFVPWFALGAGLSILSRLGLLLCESRAELNKALMLEISSVSLFGALLLLATRLDTWAFAAALAATEVLRHIAYQVLLQRVLDLRIGQLLFSYVPPLAAAAWTAAVIALGRLTAFWAGLPIPVVLVIEIVLGLFAMMLYVRLSPFRVVRNQLRNRMVAAGMLKPERSVRMRAMSLLLGRVAQSAEISAMDPRSPRQREPAPPDAEVSR
jgi:O-antigen/teichoic acid export membrane protein